MTPLKDMVILSTAYYSVTTMLIQLWVHVAISTYCQTHFVMIAGV